MSIQPISRAEVPHDVQDSAAVLAAIMEATLRYPLREFEGQPRWPATGWMIVDLVALPQSSPDRPVTRTFQARDLINDNVSVNLPVLRTLSFFNEVRKLLLFCARMNESNLAVWDEDDLNRCSADVDTDGVVALTDDISLSHGKEPLTPEFVVQLFAKATDKALENLGVYLTWTDSPLSQELSWMGHELSERPRSPVAGNRLQKKRRASN
jgi:hypothetical protein